ncbi:MAG: DUF1156 domain-containing protein [Candidatus Lokiarchaeota archaeon]|nr:DUF1156 domain-containing protein [Candidatus Lokiarchaeota archaeon]
MSNDKRFIEESFPVKEVSTESAREKNIRHGHISTLHIWWARRPLASSRATNYAALIPAPKNAEEWNKKKNFIIELSKWENSNNKKLIEKARKDILEANGGKPPKVLDPFAGGGAIPLEALRLGCEVYSNDLNPVAVLIQKCTLEYPQKYGKPISKKKYLSERPWLKSEAESENELFDNTETVNPLLEDVKYWGNWVLKEAKKEIGKFYPQEDDGSIPVGYIWARTIPCQNPSCGAEIPLMRQFWLAKKSNKKVALFPNIESNHVKFKIVGDGYDDIPDKFDPSNGTISQAVTVCPLCGTTIKSDTIRQLFNSAKADVKMVAIVLRKIGKMGKIYRVPNETDLNAYYSTEEYLKNIREKLIIEWGIDPVPDELLPRPNDNDLTNELYFNFIFILLYGMKKWSDIFKSRQLSVLITIAKFVRDSYKKLMEKGYDENEAKAVVTYISLAFNKFSTYCNTLTRWNNISESFAGKPDQDPSLAMKWDYGESNPFSGFTGSFSNQIDSIIQSLNNLVNLKPIKEITNSTATNMLFAENSFDAVFTDPPYYDNFPYSYLSDFFYIWLKRTLFDIYPEYLSTPTTPKSNEIIENLSLIRGIKKEEAIKIKELNLKSQKFFEENLKNAFKEIFRILRPNGLATVVYAHKSTSGWETLINSILDSGLIITATWPIHTERVARQRALESAALASSIYIIARKMERQSTGFYNQVREELNQYLNEKLEHLWQEGISGSDFFIAAIGSAIEVFGKYEKVIDYEGNVIRADRLLLDVRKIVTDFAVSQILHNGFAGEITDLARFYILSRWNFGAAKIPFDEARKLAQSCGIDLAQEWGRTGFIKKEKEFVRVLGPQDRRQEEIKHPAELIDVLHKTLLLWQKSNRQDILDLLTETGYGNSEAFYRVAQAISETLPNDSKEKRLLDGFLSGRERLKEEIKNDKRQGDFFKE